MVVKNLKNLMELFAYLYCLSELYGKKFKISIHAVVLVILAMFVIAGIDNYGFPQYIGSLIYIGMFAYGLLYYKDSVKVTLINCFLAYIILAIVQLLTFFPLYLFFYINYQQGYVNEFLVNIFSGIIIVLCSYKIKLKRISDFFIRKNILTIIILILVLVGFAFDFYLLKGEREIDGEIYMQMIYFFLMFSLIIYEWQKSRVAAEKRKTQLEMNKLYYDAYDKMIMLIRERQHDMKSHINAILSMIYTTDNYEELAAKQRDYCGYVMEQNEEVRLALSAGNPLIAGFMYSKIQEAESKDIEVEYKVEVKKEILAVPEYELVEIIGILMDNAEEALISNDIEGEKTIKKMYVSIKDTEECAEVIVSNSSDYLEEDMTERFFEMGYSSKGKGRGIGLAKLKKMVNEKNGNIIVGNEQRSGVNYLTFTITIPKEKRRKS